MRTRGSRGLWQSIRWLGSAALLLSSGCGGLDSTAVFGAVTSVDPLRPDASGSGAGGSTTQPGEASPSRDEAADAGADPNAAMGPARAECGSASAAQYSFGSGVSGASPVAYGEAVLDHVLIAELGSFIDSLASRRNPGAGYANGELVAQLRARLGSPPSALAERITLTLAGAPPLLEVRHADVSPAANVLSRLAGNDPGVEHRAWAAAGAFRGFADTDLGRNPRSAFSPRSLLDACFEQLEENAQNRALGLVETDPSRAALPLHVTRDGRDLKKFVQSFLVGAVAFARAVDGELDDDVAGRGLAASEERGAGQASSALEHAWDVGFGHFGAARDFDRYAGVGDAARRSGWFDTDADCRVSLVAEVNFGAASLALRSAAIGFAAEAFDAAVEGRRLLAEAPGALAGAERARLLAARDRMIASWERSLAATVLQRLNQVEAALDGALTSPATYSFTAQAEAWSELKGLSLAFQFNRRSALPLASFEAFHAAVGDAPAVPDTLPPRNRAALAAYANRLGSARKLLVDAYGFAPEQAAAW